MAQRGGTGIGERIARATAIAAATLALGAGLAFPAGGSAAVELSVPCTGAGGGPQGLVDAIQTANDEGGGTVELAAGCTYSFTSGDFDQGQGPTALPQIEAAIEIAGSDSTIERQKGSSSSFRLLEVANSDSAALTLDGVTLQQAAIAWVRSDSPDVNNGGAILLGSSGSLLVRNSVLRRNSAINGGAINSGGAPVRIVDSALRGNRAILVDGNGGAVIQVGGPLVIESSRITHNKSTGGGGGVSGQSVGGESSLLRITDSTIANNGTLENGGGGVFTFGPEELVIERSTIARNEFTGPSGAGSGAGIFNSGEMTMTDSTVTENVNGASEGENSVGGGISFDAGASGTISSSTIARNRVLGADATGGGIAAGGDLTVASTIVARNQGGNCLNPVDDGGFNLEDGQSCGFSENAVDANPRILPLADNGGATGTMALRRNSPALNVIPGSNPACGSTEDQRGVPRPEGRRCDIGALEVVATETKLRVKRGKPGRVVLLARPKPNVAIPGKPTGMVVFRDRRKRLGKAPLAGRKNRAKLKVKLRPGKHRIKATYNGSSVFLPSDSAARRLSVKRR